MKMARFEIDECLDDFSTSRDIYQEGGVIYKNMK
jgi:hypothetical protein